MSVENYENIIIGSGEGGKYLAWHLASSGQKTAVIERRWIGGSCPNINCLPSKNEIWSAKVANTVFHAGKFGSMTTPGPVNMAVVRNRKREMVQSQIQGHLDRYKTTGVELVMGDARLKDSLTVDVQLNDGGARTFVAKRLFLNLGTHAAIPPVPGLEESAPLTHIEALELDRLPEHLIVIGGGYVGLEFAQAYRRFGSRVTIVQNHHQLIGYADPDVAAALRESFEAEGIDVLTSANSISVEGRSGANVTLTVRTPSGEKAIHGSDIFVATGRIPNTSGIGLETAGIQLDADGYVHVSERLEATAPNVWAIGECAGSPQFTHASLDDFRVIRDNLAGGNRSTRDRLMPYCLFTDPQLAHIGLNETEAERRSIAVRVARLPMQSVLRAITIDETHGFMKALIDPKNDHILGFTMVGPEAGEVLSVVQMAVLAGFPYTVLRDAILTHPTMAEGLNGLFSISKAARAKAGSGSN
jgi:pyruvate/2-oxoglutarate dehydrogenase complex dihydrolipoamide dehydrogenase (E3) component